MNQLASLTFEQYVTWCRSRYPERNQWVTEEATSSADTEVPLSGEVCPVTVRSNRMGNVIVTPRIKRSQ